MEIKIKLKLPELQYMETALEKIKKLEEEYSCHCTLLELEIGFD